jgi:GntR family transcriptional regulator
MVWLMPSARREVLDRDAQEPLYEQLARIIRDRILSGDIPAGRRVPSQEELIQEHEISVRTVDSAMKLLKAEGLIEAQKGKGLFVLPEAQRRPRA